MTVVTIPAKIRRGSSQLLERQLADDGAALRIQALVAELEQKLRKMDE
jgi:hypothetical protein